MFVSASTRCFSDRPFADACQSIVDLGFDKLEIWMDERTDHLKPSLVAANLDRFVNHFREVTRMTPVAIHLEQDVELPVFEALTQLCKQMKITQVTIPAGVLGTPFNEEIDRLRSRLTCTNTGGIRLSLKTQSGHLTEDPRTAVELCQAVPGLGLTIDPSYYMVGPYANQSTDPLYPYVYHTHLRDTSPRELQVPVGLGEIDYSRVIGLLRRYNYNRVLSVEILPELLNGQDRSLEMRKLRLLLETLL